MVKRTDFLLCFFVFLTAAVTRIPFASRLLYHMDSGHFALALENYDISVHQPHPPGYFLYVMLGRLLHHVISDANRVFVSLSILFSGLAALAVFLLGREVFDRKTGLIAAAFAITSPNLWFHGEVALSYIVEAFFSCAVAYACWKTFRGEHRYIWISAVAMGIAGGIRQNTLVFLAPLWLFSVRKVPLRTIVISALLLAGICLLWFVPMVMMTGGWSIYRGAFHELWLFNTGHSSVFEKGMKTLSIFSASLSRFIFYGIGAGAVLLGLAAYSLMRRRRLYRVDGAKASFFFLWIAPPFLFYLLIFIHPANPGYVLILLPALLLLSAKAAVYLSEELEQLVRARVLLPAVITITLANAGIFLFSDIPVSSAEIRGHDRNLAMMLEDIGRHDPRKAAVFVGPYVFFGYRQIMYYLPDYYTYQVDVRFASTGQKRKIFWGKDRKTLLAERVILPAGIDTCVLPLISEDVDDVRGVEGISVRNISPAITVAAGPIARLREIFPKLDTQREGQLFSAGLKKGGVPCRGNRVS